MLRDLLELVAVVAATTLLILLALLFLFLPVILGLAFFSGMFWLVKHFFF